jgi:hypothetical protein
MNNPIKKIQVQKKEKIDIKKYFRRPQNEQFNYKNLTNYNTMEIRSDLNSPINNLSNILSKPKFTSVFPSYETLNLKTEPNDNTYHKKYLEKFQTFNNKNNYSEKIKLYRQNLNEIVNKLNESNNKYRKIINRNSDFKENISLNLNNNYNYNYNEFFAQTPNYSTTNFKYNRLYNNDTFTYNQRNKNKKIKNFGDRTDIRNNNNRMNRLIENNTNDINNENSNNYENINRLRNEFKKISSNYLEVSQRINTLPNSEIDNNDISYEEIIRNSSKLNDILNYNYKANNDSENEKVFILMKLRLKNYQIIINKLENENKKYKDKCNYKNSLAKINNKLEKENKNLKVEIEELNININSINEELQDYKNKFNNMNLFNKKIQEINQQLTNENDELKNISNLGSKDNNENQLKKLNEKYKNISEENKNIKITLKDIQTKYKILQEIHLESKQKDNSQIKLLKNEIENLNKKLKNNEKQISELKLIEKKYIKLKNDNKNLVKEKINIENKYNEIIQNKGENKKIKIKETFENLYKKYVFDKIKENKLKMLIGIYLQKQNNNFNQKIKEYKDKNKKLVKSVKKLNDEIIEFKLNKLNNNSDKKENKENNKNV